MSSIVQMARKGFRIFSRRVKQQGLRTTLIWAYARGIPKLTGTPLARYSRITQQIYVGGQYDQRGKRKLAQLGIRGVVNMRIEADDAVRGLCLDEYCYLPTIDDDAPTLDYLRQGVAFIHKVVAGGGKVYIHCAGGIGRAPSMAAAYFVAHGFSLDEAIRLIQKTRPFIYITPVQMTQLRRFEAEELARQQTEASLTRPEEESTG
jgi:protein tyrosine phosphatase (PTP) superfamily phosphohydrolase (DUF442 family)